MRNVLWSSVLVAFLSGCGGNVVDPDDNPVGDEMPSPGMPGTPPSPPPATPPAVKPPPGCLPRPGRVTLRRLNRGEYNRTVRDLFGIQGRPADAFPPDPVAKTFDNDADLLSVNGPLAELYFEAAERVVAEAFQRGRAQIMVCDSVQAGRVPCARTILTSVGERVFRRPPTPQEIDDLLPLVDLGEKQGDGFEGGIRIALQAMLSAPQFLFRGVRAPGPGQAVIDLDDHELATRLSYFLWGSTPDAVLLRQAAQKKLHDPAVLRAEMTRLLRDPKAAGLFEGFARQWLSLAKLSTAAPSPARFPNFDEALRADMGRETELFWTDLVQQDRSPADLVTGGATFVNARLAQLYGIAGVTGTTFQRLPVDRTQRTGILTHAGMLTMGSDPDRTNVIKRGLWVASSLLCAEPPPPPDNNVAALAPQRPGESVRQQLERHRSNPACIGCHALIDPVGFGLEAYDPIGRWRTSDAAGPVDNVGVLPDGRRFTGAIELGRLLEADDGFKVCVTHELLVYALGRQMAAADSCAVEAIGQATVKPQGRFSELLWAIVTSDAFQRQEREGP